MLTPGACARQIESERPTASPLAGARASYRRLQFHGGSASCRFGSWAGAGLMRPGNGLGRSRLRGTRAPYTLAGEGRMILAGTLGDMPVGQRRPLDTPFARVCNKPLLAWALDQGLIAVNADGSWHLTEVALEWLRHQPLKATTAVLPWSRDLPCPDRYDA